MKLEKAQADQGSSKLATHHGSCSSVEATCLSQVNPDSLEITQSLVAKIPCQPSRRDWRLELTMRLSARRQWLGEPYQTGQICVLSGGSPRLKTVNTGRH